MNCLATGKDAVWDIYCGSRTASRELQLSCDVRQEQTAYHGMVFGYTKGILLMYKNDAKVRIRINMLTLSGTIQPTTAAE